MKQRKTQTKRVISMLIAVVMLLGLLPAGIISINADAITPDTSWYDENESATEYEIGTAAELLGFGKLMYDKTTLFLGKTVKLTADIDLNPAWLASATAPVNVWKTGTLQGVFDGQGHSISGLWADKNSVPGAGGRVGLFRNMEGATVQNLAILNSYFTGVGGQGVGSVVGSATYNSRDTMATDFNKIINVYSEAIVYCPGNAVGGLVGTVGNETNGVEVENCVFAGTVTATGIYVGGIVGNGNGNPVSITDCVNLGYVSADDEMGGILGRNTGETSIDNCVNLGLIANSHTDNLVGDIFGNAKESTMTFNNCYWIGGAENKTGEALNRAFKVDTINKKNTNVTLVGGGQIALADVAATLAADGDKFAGWTKLNGTTISLPAYIVTNFGAEAKAVVMEMYDVTIAYQEPATGTDSIRFIGIVNLDEAELASFETLGFKITTTYNGNTYTKTVPVTTVYTSVIADGAKVEATDFGGNYFYVVEIGGLDAALTDATANIVMAVSIVTVTDGVETEYDFGFTHTIEKAAA